MEVQGLTGKNQSKGKDCVYCVKMDVSVINMLPMARHITHKGKRKVKLSLCLTNSALCHEDV
jgi:hypothetical protein